MKYAFKIGVYTDGDFYLKFVPCGMNYDGSYRYTFDKSYTNRDMAIEDISSICSFLKEQMSTSRDYVKESWNKCIDDFVKKLKESNEAEHITVEEYMTGNYDGTEFVFRAEPQYINCGFYVTDEEYEMIKNSSNGVTNDTIKKAVLNLFKK